jgi:hypothetical protein
VRPLVLELWPSVADKCRSRRSGQLTQEAVGRRPLAMRPSSAVPQNGIGAESGRLLGIALEPQAAAPMGGDLCQTPMQGREVAYAQSFDPIYEPEHAVNA